ncbi:MAG: fatty acid desaturase CarF family protein [Halioglobus sp.]
MTNPNDNPVAQPVGLETIERLSASGVQVANGSGMVWQKLLVACTMAASLYFAITGSVADPVFLCMLLPVLLAIDFLSGFVHWFFDTQVEPSSTFLGHIAVDFLDHHVRPGRTVEVGFFASAWRPALMVSLPMITLSLLVPLPAWLAAVLFWMGFLSMLVPQTHKEAHRAAPLAAISLLQKTRLIINPAAHADHHHDNRASFCVFTGWLNPLLNRTRFWRGMEHLFDTVRRR